MKSRKDHLIDSLCDTLRELLYELTGTPDSDGQTGESSGSASKKKASKKKASRKKITRRSQSQQEEQTPQEEPEPPAQESSADIEFDAMKKKVLEVVHELGRDAAEDILKQFVPSGKFPEVEQSDYQTLWDACQSAIDGGEEEEPEANDDPLGLNG